MGNDKTSTPVAVVKYPRGKTIRHIGCGRLYIVRQDPSTCTHNDKPSYLLEQVGLGPRTPPFYRSQADVEALWEDLHIPTIESAATSSFNKFDLNEDIEFKDTGERFRVVGVPPIYSLADSGEGAYVYEARNFKRFVIAQSDMEDGRFVKADQSKYQVGYGHIGDEELTKKFKGQLMNLKTVSKVSFALLGVDVEQNFYIEEVAKNEMFGSRFGVKAVPMMKGRISTAFELWLDAAHFVVGDDSLEQLFLEAI